MHQGRILTKGALRFLRTQHQEVFKRTATGSTASYICRRCLSQSAEASQPPPSENTKGPNSHPTSSPPATDQDLSTIFTTPTWSVRSLLPQSSESVSSSQSQPPSPETTTMTPTTLHHLLRLSALPPPETPAEEASMLATLQAQLHFVRDIQSVDTTGIEPLRSIRDETSAGMAESTVTLDTLREALSRETVMGHRRRPRRVKGPGDGERSAEEKLVEAATAGRRENRYFVVASAKAKRGGE
ncbi:Glutamyl-tRNA(Gln) amidotransferase subunit F, mitochondrial [Cytospora mali]|uniref:Glutamyl-tRNA(Gln) amidotransferase subunit F, mitochondrial n=1 Tax=Cytospora mali TaxID=578113 RepID=A0A194UUN1_CYTMA|nr:Glutamyl-tRNA(Gln) amidotransferase subunit F, mitochondrial [Valsa mali var. pyri (nom. inval.)]